MQHTPNRPKIASDMSFGLSPISFQTPNTFKFYQKSSNHNDCTPNQKKNMIMSLINSPMDPLSVNTKRLLLLKSMDIMHEFIETHYIQLDSRSQFYYSHSSSTDSSAQKHKTLPSNATSALQKTELIKNQSKSILMLDSSNKDHIQATKPNRDSLGFDIYQQSSDELKDVTISAHQLSGLRPKQLLKKKLLNRPIDASNEDIQLKTAIQDAKRKKNSIKIAEMSGNSSATSSGCDSNYSDQKGLLDITNLNKNGCEIRKRKRKSNQQLKILKWEFERDGVWNKDKILNVAKITGLSESQVYKWCWDQKKKMGENFTKQDIKDMGYSEDDEYDKLMEEDKENIPPTPTLAPTMNDKLNKSSKHISKLKNKSRALQNIKFYQGLKIRDTNQIHHNHSHNSHFRLESINKKIDFSEH